MNDRNTIVNQIQDGLGDGGSRELAERIFAVLRSDDRIYYTDARGLVLRDEVDLIAVAAEMAATYRAAYVGDVVLTTPEQAALSDSELREAAKAEAFRCGLIGQDTEANQMSEEEFDDALRVGEWTEV